MGGTLVLPLHERRVPVAEGFRQHLDAAAALPFKLDARLRAAALPRDVEAAVIASVRLGEQLAPARAAALCAFRDAMARVRPISARIAAALMPATVAAIAGKVNVAGMAAAIDAFGWLDVDLPRRFTYGFPIVGDIPDSGVYRRLDVTAAARSEHAVRLAFFHDTAPAWNRRLETRLRYRAWASPLDRAADIGVSEKSQKELSKGVIVGPFTSTLLLHNALANLHPQLPRASVLPRPMVRFGVPQKGSIRAIDDGRGNGANAATLMHETVSTPHFVYPAVYARAVAAAARELGISFPALTLALCDLAMAYRTVPTSQPWLTTMAFYDPRATPPGPRYYYLPGHNFGLVSAVVNFNRFPELVVVIARVLVALPAEHYYDDFIVPDLQIAGRSGLDSIETIILHLADGVRRSPRALVRAPELDPEKTEETAPSNTLLGVVCDLSRAHLPEAVVSFRVDAERVAAVLASFETAFAAGTLSPHEASRLRGKLFFVLSAAFGAVGRAATLPLVQRQYRDTSHSFLAGSELHHSLLFFQALLPRLPRLSLAVVPSDEPPLLIYTDASFSRKRNLRRLGASAAVDLPGGSLSGALGAVVFDPVTNEVRYAAAQPNWAILLSSWRVDRKTYIAELEELAAIAVYSTYPDLVQGRKVHHFIDNTVALSALVNGYSGKLELAKMTNIFYMQMIGLRASVYFDYVPSKANIADLPSRARFDLLLPELRGLAVRGLAPDTLVVPSVASWRADLDTWADRHSLRAGTAIPI